MNIIIIGKKLSKQSRPRTFAGSGSENKKRLGVSLRAHNFLRTHTTIPIKHVFLHICIWIMIFLWFIYYRSSTGDIEFLSKLKLLLIRYVNVNCTLYGILQIPNILLESHFTSQFEK